MNIRMITLIALMVLVTAGATGAATTTDSVEMRGTIVEVTGTTNIIPTGGGTAASTYTWNPYNFAAFWYDEDGDLKSEELTIAAINDRTIAKDKLYYNTTPQWQNHTIVKDGVASSLGVVSGNNVTGYAVEGWMEERYVAISRGGSWMAYGNKLARPLIEYTSYNEKKILTEGVPWDLGGGFTLNATNVGSDSVVLSLDRDGVNRDTSIINPSSDRRYMYTAELSGVAGVVVFFCYIDAVCANDPGFVQLKYVYLIDDNIIEVNVDETYGNMKVSYAGTAGVCLRNDAAIDLGRGTEPEIMEDMHFRVADSDTVRFYPYKVHTEPGEYDVRGTIVNVTGTTNIVPAGGGTPAATYTWNPYNFAAFWYDGDDDLRSEELYIAAICGRTISKDKLYYNTTPQWQYYALVNDGVASSLGTVSGNNVTDYAVEGWMAEKYVAISKGGTWTAYGNKLAKLLVEFVGNDTKKLVEGEPWDMGGGFTLNATQICSDGSVILSIDKNGVNMDTSIINPSSDRRYMYRTELSGVAEVVVFFCYIDAVSVDDTSFVQLKYVFLIDNEILKVSTDETYGKMKVTSAGTCGITLKNDDSISLSQNSEEDIMGNISFRVADSDTIRFYPCKTYTIGGDPTPPSGTIPDTDTDRDGVPDVWDADNSTQEGYWVNPQGIGRRWGDMNGDGVLTSVDALMILQAAADGICL